MKKRSSRLLVLTLLLACAALFGIAWQVRPQPRAMPVAERSCECCGVALERAESSYEPLPLVLPPSADERRGDTRPADKKAATSGSAHEAADGGEETVPQVKVAHRPIKFIQDDQGARLDPESLGPEIDYDVTIRGRVIDAQDVPVAGAGLFGDFTITGYNESDQPVYGANGRLDDAEGDNPRIAIAHANNEGEFEVRFSRRVHEAFEITVMLCAQSRGKARSLPVAVGITREAPPAPVTLRLRLAGRLAGRVVDPQGNGVGGVTVYVADHVGTLLEDHQFDDYLHSGYNIRIRPMERDDETRLGRATLNLDQLNTLNSLGDGGNLRAYLKLVQLPTEVFSGVTDAAGNFLIEDIAVGDYEVGPRLEGWRFVGEPVKVKLIEGANELGQPLVLTSKGKFRVKLKDGNGNAVTECITVEFVDGAQAAMQPTGYAYPDAEGVIEIENAPLNAAEMRLTWSGGKYVLPVSTGSRSRDGEGIDVVDFGEIVLTEAPRDK